MVFANNLFAIHYRAGEITYRLVVETKYEITVTTYTDATKKNQVDPVDIEIFFGDDKSQVVKRSNGINGSGELVPFTNNKVQKNIYITTHIYPGDGGYPISITDNFRIDGIVNINNGATKYIPFYLETILYISGGSGMNHSPILTAAPIDEGCIGRIFTHNPGATDADGDSLAFSIKPPKMANKTEVPGYIIPEFSELFSINFKNGQLSWITPVKVGYYNFVIQISEYRSGKLLSKIDRDMQVLIGICQNHPPVFEPVRDTCIEANELLKYYIKASDPDSPQRITITKFGGPFIQSNSPATISPDPAIGPYTGDSTLFSWKPSCNAIRFDEHRAVFKVTDNDPVHILTSFLNWNIKVVGPAPKNVQIAIEKNGFKISWDKDICDLAYGYNIYRKVDSGYWHHGPCETGVASNSGYVLLDTTKGLNNTTYFDNNNGIGISPLVRYCYIITTIYAPRTDAGYPLNTGKVAEGYASDEVCELILRTKPVITNVDIESTSADSGKIFIKWIKPLLLDSNQFKPPYQMQLQRSLTIAGGYLNVGNAITYSSFAAINDEQKIDSNLNTLEKQYFYKVVFIANTNTGPESVEESIAASSVGLTILPANRSLLLKWNVNVPWVNTQTIIYRKNTLQLYDSIGFSETNQFLDTGLYNGISYCYYVKTQGNYNLQFYPFLLYNKSQELCDIPKDTIRPCTPQLKVESPCNNLNDFKVYLNWIYPETCDKDVIHFKVLWRKNSKENWVPIETVKFGLNQYIDARESLKKSIAGCYAVVAVDSFGNESYPTNTSCINNCPVYAIPNIFTPNGDGKNDLLNPFPYRFVDKIDISIFNRWGQQVYHSNDIDINWNGKENGTNEDCTEGVYFYICDVFENYLDGLRKTTIKGTITLIR